jgi:hypothetical protein
MRLVVGENQATIARDFDLHRSQVCWFARRQDIRPFIEQEQLKVLEALPDAVEIRRFDPIVEGVFGAYRAGPGSFAAIAGA